MVDGVGGTVLATLVAAPTAPLAARLSIHTAPMAQLLCQRLMAKGTPRASRTHRSPATLRLLLDSTCPISQWLGGGGGMVTSLNKKKCKKNAVENAIKNAGLLS